MTTKPLPTTALDLADKVEAISPVDLKNSLVTRLRWQHAHGHRPGHIRQYVEAAYYKMHPRPETLTRQMASVASLTNGIGQSVS